MTKVCLYHILPHLISSRKTENLIYLRLNKHLSKPPGIDVFPEAIRLNEDLNRKERRVPLVGEVGRKNTASEL